MENQLLSILLMYEDKIPGIKENINYFSYYKFQKTRLELEINYLTHLIMDLSTLQNYNNQEILKFLYNIYHNFDFYEYEKMKYIENDVKSVELYIKQKIEETNNPFIQDLIHFIHFGLTNQDINNMTYTIIIKKFINDIYIKNIHLIIKKLDDFYDTYKHSVILIQNKELSTLGKELKVFSYQLSEELNNLCNYKIKCKFGGVNGCFSAHNVAYPNKNWIDFADNFVYSYELNRIKYMTHIDKYENLYIVFDSIKRFNIIIKNLCNELCFYITKNYFISIKNNNTTTIQIVSPVHFKNAKENVDISKTFFEFELNKFRIINIQNDFNIETAFLYSLIALKNVLIGFSKITPNLKKIQNDLNSNYIVLMGAYETILRKHKNIDAFKLLKNIINQKNKLTKELLTSFINELNINENVKQELLNININKYTGFV